jgi:hypothetical protein
MTMSFALSLTMTRFFQRILNKEDQPVVHQLGASSALLQLVERQGIPASCLRKAVSDWSQRNLRAWLSSAYRGGMGILRVVFRKALLKYPWESFPPEPGTANIADVSSKDLISDYVEGYTDGYPVSAPSGSFKPNALGIRNLAGNVSEWCHDYYSIYPQQPEKEEEDPTGPGEGQHRVVRGSSYKHGSISALRCAYRDYSNARREDLGFRVCRYADEILPKK